MTVTARGGRDYDLRTPEVSTNVTPEQIKDLPQNSRNFLNFAALAPGVAVTADFGEDTRYGGAMFRSGGQDARQVNVFIDGLSYKNDILKGGAFMQDSSRGNPFPQDSVAEFQVLTQNYKAEYEKAAAAVINVSTKSGTNDLHGDAFLYYQSRRDGREDPFPDARKARLQALPVGRLARRADPPRQALRIRLLRAERPGPVQHRVSSGIRRPSRRRSPPGSTGFDQGDVEAPFQFQALLREADVAARGGPDRRAHGNLPRRVGSPGLRRHRRAFSTGVDQQVKTYAVTARLNSVFGNLVNDASLSYQQMKWIQGAIDTSAPHLNYFDIAEIGGREHDPERPPAALHACATT